MLNDNLNACVYNIKNTYFMHSSATIDKHRYVIIFIPTKEYTSINVSFIFIVIKFY